MELSIKLLDVEGFKSRDVKLNFLDYSEYQDKSFTNMFVGGKDKELIALYFDNEFILIYDISNEEKSVFPISEIIARGVSEFSFSPDGSLLATSIDNNILIWETEFSPNVFEPKIDKRGRPLRRLKAHTDTITDIKFVTDNHLYSFSGNGSVRVWLPRIGEWNARIGEWSTKVGKNKPSPIFLNEIEGLILDHVGGVYFFPNWIENLKNQKVHGLTLRKLAYKPKSISFNMEDGQILIGAMNGTVRAFKHNNSSDSAGVKCSDDPINHIKLSSNSSKYIAIDSNNSVFVGELSTHKITCNKLSDEILDEEKITSLLIDNMGKQITLTTAKNDLIILDGEKILVNKKIYDSTKINMYAQLDYLPEESNIIVRLIDGTKIQLDNTGKTIEQINTTLSKESQTEENETHITKLLLANKSISSFIKLVYAKGNNLFFGIKSNLVDTSEPMLVIQDIVNNSKYFLFRKIFQETTGQKD